MKKIISSTLFALALIAMSVAVGATANAQSTTTEPPTTPSTQTKRCTVAQGRLNIRITTFDEVKKKQTVAYGELLTTFETRIDSAQKNGYDVTEMTKARDVIKTKIEVFTQKNVALATAVMATKNLSCGNSDGEFVASLATSRAALLETRTAATGVRTAFKDGAVSSLKAYATWLNQQAEEKK